MARQRDPSLMMEPTKGKNGFDPSSNVLLLVEAANRRQDDLRVAEMRRLEDLRVAESKRVDEILKIRSEYSSQLTLAESKRIDAIRAVDVAAVATQANAAAQQATVLANQVSTSAETLRTLVKTTADTAAAQAAQQNQAIIERLQQLEKSQYKGEGRSGVADPAMVDLIAEVKALNRGSERGAGKSAGMNLFWAVLVGMFSIAGVIWAVLK